MQTFLTSPDLKKSIETLDYRRFGKQRVEASQILVSLARNDRWSKHPAVQMWKGCEELLKHYLALSIDDWVDRGYKNTMTKPVLKAPFLCKKPWWLGDDFFHRSHQSNLLRKFPEYYCLNGWAVGSDLPYAWPNPDVPGEYRLRHSVKSSFWDGNKAGVIVRKT